MEKIITLTPTEAKNARNMAIINDCKILAKYGTKKSDIIIIIKNKYGIQKSLIYQLIKEIEK
jgi:hypothetical protein